ncbi:MAG: hypothetical protein LUD22_03270 [Coprobacillus sp.]|nr:hypothetical protein [Coprobacillus sp.]
MAKITRKSYRRRRIVFGVAIFASVGLVSTGLAVFALTTNASASTPGNVDVGNLSDTPLTITLGFSEDSSNSFYFEPVPGFTYIYPSGNSDVESLSVTIEGTVGSISRLDKLSVQLESHQGITNAVNGDYVIAPDCYQEEVYIYEKTNNLVIGADTGGDGIFINPYDTDTYIFRYTISFQWGSLFNGLNPAEYYEEIIGNAYDEGGYREGEAVLEEAKETLERMRSAFVDYKYDEEDLLSSRTLAGYSSIYYKELADDEKASIPIAAYEITVFAYAN